MGSGGSISSLIASTTASGKMSRSLNQSWKGWIRFDKLGVVDDENVKEDSDGHDGCGCVHQVGAQPESKFRSHILADQELTGQCRRVNSLLFPRIPPAGRSQIKVLGCTTAPPAKEGKCCRWSPRRWWGWEALQRGTWRRSGSRRRATCLGPQRIAGQLKHCQP